MKYLLDTHAFLWLIADAPALSRKVKRIFENDENEFCVSLASVWEMAIKVSLGKLTVPSALQGFLADQFAENGISTLEVTFRHACRVSELPFHHRDPFDRLIAAQCLEDALPMLSVNSVFDQYGVKRIW